MRNLLALIVLLGGGFLLVGMYVAPNQPPLRDWYRVHACPHLDKLSTQICDPIRKAESDDRI